MLIYEISMLIEPTITALTSEINPPMYIDLQIVRMTDGLNRFQAIALYS